MIVCTAYYALKFGNVKWFWCMHFHAGIAWDFILAQTNKQKTTNKIRLQIEIHLSLWKNVHNPKKA